ncbi:MAG: PGF-pre-PGF domain-containing protein, partial [Candidatus Aenigmarchaeota archaeon]|nr:PGF-pre-PGF domain-containing protein [Candidatus Aenigmarchaeota archaeon]
ECTVTLGNVADGTYDYYVWINDTAGNQNQTQTRTITIDYTSPTINSPADAFYPQDVSATIGWIIEDNHASGYYRVYRNGTIQNQSSWDNNSNLDIYVNTSVIGMWNYTIYYNDSFGNMGIPDEIMIIVSADVPPTVNLNTPIDNYYSSEQAVVFNCSATDDHKLANITLYGNWSGWHANETEDITGIWNSTTFIKNITDGTYIWNCIAYDNSSQSAFANANRTITIDTTAPIINITSPTNENKTYKQGGENLTINYNFTELNPKNITLYVLNQSDGVIASIVINGLIGGASKEGNATILLPYNMTKGYFHINAIIYDFSANNNTDTQINTTYNGASIITIISPVNATALSSGTTQYLMEINTDENTTCRHSIDSDFDYVNGTNFTITGEIDHSFLYTGLSNGNSFNVYYKCNNTNGTLNYRAVHHYFSVSSPSPPSSSSSSSSSSSGGGGGGGIIPTTETKTVNFTANLPKKIQFNAAMNYIKQIQIKTNKNIQNIKIIVKKLSSKPKDISTPKLKNIYKYIQITHENLTDERIESAYIYFAVEKEWLKQNGGEKNRVVLFRYNINKWEKLDTNYYNFDETYYYFKAKSNGLSYFSIGIDLDEEIVVPEDDEETIIFMPEEEELDTLEEMESIKWEVLQLIAEAQQTIDEFHGEENDMLIEAQQKLEFAVQLCGNENYHEARQIVQEAIKLIEVGTYIPPYIPPEKKSYSWMIIPIIL